MQVHHRPFDPSLDLPHALRLADVSGLNIPHMADWPYRFSSWALDQVQNTQVWLNVSSEMIGWVIMQTPFWAIDCVVYPEAPTELYRDMLAWAKARAAEMQAAGTGRPMWFVSIAADRHERRRDLEVLGFSDQAEVGEDAWSKVLFELPPQMIFSTAFLPAGYTVRSLDSHTEIQAYVDLHRQVFESESMTYAWRANSVRTPGYINDLDLVVVSDKGELQGFCVAWLRTLASGETVGQIEPLGVRQSQRGQKLSKVLLGEAVRRLRAHGASRVYVETDRQRASAMAAYTSMGFQVAHEVLVYRWEVDPQRTKAITS